MYMYNVHVFAQWYYVWQSQVKSQGGARTGPACIVIMQGICVCMHVN